MTMKKIVEGKNITHIQPTLNTKYLEVAVDEKGLVKLYIIPLKELIKSLSNLTFEVKKRQVREYLILLEDERNY